MGIPQRTVCFFDGVNTSIGLSRLKIKKTPGVFARHDYQDLSDRLELPEKDEELDIEMDIQGDRLWIVGSHTSTRRKFERDEDTEANLDRLSQVRLRPNRILIASARLDGGELRDDTLTPDDQGGERAFPGPAGGPISRPIPAR